MIKHEKENSETITQFEMNKVSRLNKFFMKNTIIGFIFSLLLFLLTICLLVLTIVITKIDESVKITMISMIATFILTTSKTLIDRTIETVTYAVKILGEEQRGFNKKMGIELEKVEFGELPEERED